MYTLSKIDFNGFGKERCINPYPHYLKITNTLSDARALMGDREKADLEADETTVTVAGRIMFKRAMGKAGFAHIQDRSDKLQIYINKKVVGEEAFAAWKSCAMGDHVHITATLMRTRTGEPTLNAIEFTLSAKCISSMPDKHKGMTDIESRSRSRYVDLFMNEDSRENLHDDLKPLASLDASLKSANYGGNSDDANHTGRCCSSSVHHPPQRS